MRNGSHRFWLCISTAVAVMVIAVPAASAGVHKYDSRVTIFHEAPGPHTVWHGSVISVRKCMDMRRVILFEQRPGADRRLGATRTHINGGDGDWGLVAPAVDRAYAKVTREVHGHDRYVCRADRSGTITRGFGHATD
jgi:hypothetical protein